jgi:hypothetical protein
MVLLCEPLIQTQDRLVAILLEFNLIVKCTPDIAGVLVRGSPAFSVSL